MEHPDTGRIDGGKLVNASITGAKFAPGALDGAVTDNSVTTSRIKDGEVQLNDLANGIITVAKLAPCPSGSAVGNISKVQVSQSFASGSSPWAAVPTASIDLAVTGRPVLVGFFSGQINAPNPNSNHQIYVGLRIMREDISSGIKTQIAYQELYSLIEVVSGHQHPPSNNVPASLIVLDTPPQGNYRYTLERQSFFTCSVSGQLAALEL